MQIKTHLAFLLGTLQDALLDGVFGDQAIDGHLLLLAQAVRAVHGLRQMLKII